MRRALPLALAAALLAPLPALAHPGDHHLGFIAGLAHPLGGLDHLLAMIALGLWAGLIGGTARWALPTGFLGGMALGGLLGAAGVALPLVEPGILASLVVLGGLAAFTLRLPLPAALAVAAGFGLLHGHAHGAEALGAAIIPYGAGVLLATALLHGVGLALAAPASARASTSACAR